MSTCLYSPLVIAARTRGPDELEVDCDDLAYKYRHGALQLVSLILNRAKDIHPSQ